MKIIAILIALLLIGTASAAQVASPDTLKILMPSEYGMQIFVAWQNETTGAWTVVYTDTYTDNPKMFFGNETGFVRIT